MAAERTAAGGNRLAITVCVILATLMQALDTTIANVALPYMQGSAYYCSRTRTGPIPLRWRCWIC